MRIPLPFPITMVGRIDPCVLINLRSPADEVATLVPHPLALDTHSARGQSWAFWNIVVCRVIRMRPRHAPAFAGLTYHHIAYRLRVRARDGSAHGLYFLRSDVDNPLIATAGDILSDFRFHRAAVERNHTTTLNVTVTPKDPAARLELRCDLNTPTSLTPDSVFDTLDAARTRLKYQPLSLAPTATAARNPALRLAEVFRNEQDWRERPITITHLDARFFNSIPTLKTPPTLELATFAEPINYRWRLGRVHRLNN